MKGAMIGYRCVAEQHRTTVAGNEGLTVHDGQWAYCAFDRKADGHRWELTGGVPLSALMRASLLRGGGRLQLTKRADGRPDY